MVTRRRFIAGAASTGILACGPKAPLVRTSRPRITHGTQVGDVQTQGAYIWARCNEPARMVVEASMTPRFDEVYRRALPVAPDSDGADVLGLDTGAFDKTIYYRVRFERQAERGASDWALGSFKTPRTDRVRFAWTGDTCGQGFGRNEEWGGLRGYKAIHDAQPDFLLHSGDMIYGDNPIPKSITLPNGEIWNNRTNDVLERVAESLDDFRARFKYVLEDEHARRLASDTSIIASWDDHETHNNWWPGQQLADDRYRERDASKLAALAKRAFFEWTPTPRGSIHRKIAYGPLLDVFVVDCRSFRTPNDGAVATDMLGSAQAQWLVDELAKSRARWKVVACDQPLGLVIGDGPGDALFEGFANRPGPPAGREVELARILSALKAKRVKNVVWLTADVHYAAAHHYDPARAVFTDFDPFWEFVAGPIHAGTFGPNDLDPTFGPEVRFQWAPPPGTGKLPPWDGLQSFGTVELTREAATIALFGIDGKQRYSIELPHVD